MPLPRGSPGDLYAVHAVEMSAGQSGEGLPVAPEPGLSWRHTYWAPDTGEHLSLFESSVPRGVSAEPGAAAAAPHAAREVDPAAYEDIADAMPQVPGGSLFLVPRPAGPMSQDDVDAGVLRAIVGAADLGNLRWRRSYWTDDWFFCLYEATAVDAVIEHSHRCQLPLREERPAVPVRVVQPSAEPP